MDVPSGKEVEAFAGNGFSSRMESSEFFCSMLESLFVVKVYSFVFICFYSSIVIRMYLSMKQTRTNTIHTYTFSRRNSKYAMSTQVSTSSLDRGSKLEGLLLFHPIYTRAFGDRPRNLDSWSSDADDTCAGTPPLLTTTPAGGRLSSRQIQTHDIPGTSLLP
ncbi:hypothetical protein TNCV_1704241 [Trichonephila clavipes]|nr:hypothetical protein TNCV_1704241 [Trichonephila clavipes]